MKIVIDMRVHEPALAALNAVPGVSVHVLENPEERGRKLPLRVIEDCEVLFCTFPPENIEVMRALRFIQISSAGYTQLIDKGLSGRGVRAANALGVFDVPIAEWNAAMMVNLARDVRGMLHNQDAKVWDRSARFQQEIRGSTVGIWGYGGIGRETARLAKAMGMRVHVLVRNGVKSRADVYCVSGTGDPEGVLPDRVFGYADREPFLRELDFLVMAVPQTASTVGIVGKRELEMLKQTAFILNPSRGPLIQEHALLEALSSKRVAGAALDTHYAYPMPPDHPLWEMPSVIMTPHISGSSLSPHFLERVWDIFVQNIKRLQRSENLLNEIPGRELDAMDQSSQKN